MFSIRIYKALLVVLFSTMTSHFALNLYRYNEFPETWKLVTWALTGLAAALFLWIEWSEDQASEAALRKAKTTQR